MNGGSLLSKPSIQRRLMAPSSHVNTAVTGGKITGPKMNSVQFSKRCSEPHTQKRGEDGVSLVKKQSHPFHFMTSKVTAGDAPLQQPRYLHDAGSGRFGSCGNAHQSRTDLWRYPGAACTRVHELGGGGRSTGETSVRPYERRRG